MENSKQYLEIPLTDINIIGKQIYNTETNKYGMISGLFLEKFAGTLGHFYEAYYDKIDHNEMVFSEDLHKGKIKFVIVDMPKFKEFNNQQIDEIKEFMGENFSENTIFHITEEEQKKHCDEQEWSGIQEIMGKAKELDTLAADIVQDNYSMLKYFTLFIDGIITENQMLYGLVNVLSSELRVKKDKELKEFTEKFKKDTEAIVKENFQKWIEENTEK